jgi:hypothetical protein
VENGGFRWFSEFLGKRSDCTNSLENKAVPEDFRGREPAAV